jgi:hypothetical protein
MSNPTTPFGWQMPTATDLVTDLPADFEVFGQAVATSMADLLGGTSGQILAKNSNTDMDFVWIANDQGDITGVTATSPLTGGGTSGAITIGIQDATTSVKGSVQLSDSTSTTSSVLASTPTATKSAYDLANTANTTADAAIAKAIVDAKGDLIGATAADTPARLAVGTNGQVLTADSTAATGLKYADPVAGWTSYTPTWTNLTVGNGTLVGAYRDNGSMIDLSVKLTFGSTTSVSGQVSFSLPFNAETTNIDTFRAGGRYLDSGVREILSYFQVKTSTAECRYAYVNPSGSGVSYEIMSNVVAAEPWTWATNDQIMAFFSYRKA